MMLSRIRLKKKITVILIRTASAHRVPKMYNCSLELQVKKL